MKFIPPSQAAFLFFALHSLKIYLCVPHVRIAVNLRNVIRSLLTELHVDCEPLIATNRPLLTELAAKVRRTVLFVEKETQGVQIECCKFSYSQLMITFEERMKQI